jgi:hypothetical protein
VCAAKEKHEMLGQPQVSEYSGVLEYSE